MYIIVKKERKNYIYYHEEGILSIIIKKELRPLLWRKNYVRYHEGRKKELRTLSWRKNYARYHEQRRTNYVHY